MADTMPPSSDDGKQARRRVGAYAKLLANYASDDAIIEAGEAAELLFVRGLAFCATSDADGFITDAQVVRYVGAGMKDALKRAERLAATGLWERLDGGYLVRSWTKIHETAADKGRRRKADRERKRKTPDSEPPSETIPAGIHAEDAAESLSMTLQCSDTTPQGSATDGSLGGERPEPLRAVPVTEPPLSSSTDARCTAHRGVANPGPCNGCRAARERAEAKASRAAEQIQREAEAAARNCTRCDGVRVVDDQGNPTRKLCDHRRSA